MRVMWRRLVCSWNQSPCHKRPPHNESVSEPACAAKGPLRKRRKKRSFLRRRANVAVPMALRQAPDASAPFARNCFGVSDRRAQGCGRDAVQGVRTERQLARFGRVLGTLIAEKRLQTLVSEVFRLQDLLRQVPENEAFPHGQRTTFQVGLHSWLSNVGQAVARKVPKDQSASKNFNSGADSYSSGPS